MSDRDTPTPTTEDLAWQRLRTALGAAGMGTWHLDLCTGVLTHDENLNGILGRESKETTGSLDDPEFTRVHPDDRARVRDAIDTAIATHADYSVEFRVVGADGRVRWLRDRGRILLDDAGMPVSATGAVMDITEQRRLEDHDRMLAAAAQVLATSVDDEETLTALPRMLVPRFADWASVHLSEVDGPRQIAATGAEDLAPDERQITETISTGKPVCEARLLLLPLRAGPNTIGVMTYAARVRLFDREAVSFAKELADRTALSIDRARLLRDLQRASRIKDDFLAALSHELRTPLNAVLGWTRMLRRGTVPADKTQAILETIERNVATQMQLVEELLDLSAMVGGGLRLNVTRVDLGELVGGAVETVRPAADAKTLRVKVTVGDGVEEITGDLARLRQVLWNLLSNAVKFTPAGGEIEVSVVDGPADVEVTVRNTGPGISPEFLPFVFEPFRQADSSATRAAGGLGLGLAIVRHIVEAHGGTVTAQSDGRDRGSVFSVRLPTGRPPESAGVPLGTASLRGRRVLAVDDDESTQELVATMLLMYGVSVRTADRASQAMSILSEWRPDVLLADLAMPGEDGYALVRRVRALPSPLGSIPAVALTAYTDPQSVQMAFAAGFDAHLGKPLEPHVLADALARVLRLRRRAS
ncbi:MAG TPA: ATP-binding protein [Vicinamibacterales bacterium]